MIIKTWRVSLPWGIGIFLYKQPKLLQPKNQRKSEKIEATAVIGHGPSMDGCGLGGVIDFHRYVIRFLHCNRYYQNPVDYGSRVSFYCGTVGKLRDRKIESLPETGFVVWNKSGNLPSKYRVEFESYLGFVDASQLVGKWRDEMLPGGYLSSGCVGILVATAVIGLPVRVFGCDNLRGGDSGDYRGSAERTGVGPGGVHDYAVERKIVDAASAEYGVPINFIK